MKSAFQDYFKHRDVDIDQKFAVFQRCEKRKVEMYSRKY